jgi:hypothetical protein
MGSSIKRTPRGMTMKAVQILLKLGCEWLILAAQFLLMKNPDLRR